MVVRIDLFIVRSSSLLSWRTFDHLRPQSNSAHPRTLMKGPEAAGPMAHADLLAEILRLPAEERARLALELIRNLDTHAEAAAADACAEIARRGTEVDAGMAATMTVDEYRAHVRQRRAARGLR